MIRTMMMVLVLFASVYCNPARGQAPAATLYIELQNVVEYQVDTSDLSKYGTDPSVTQGKAAKGLGRRVRWGPNHRVWGYRLGKWPARKGLIRRPRSGGLHEPNSRRGRRIERNL